MTDLRRYFSNLKVHCTHPLHWEKGAPSLATPPHPPPTHPPTHTHTKAQAGWEACFGNEAPREAQGMNSCKDGCGLWSSAPLEVGAGEVGAEKKEVLGLPRKREEAVRDQADGTQMRGPEERVGATKQTGKRSQSNGRGEERNRNESPRMGTEMEGWRGGTRKRKSELSRETGEKRGSGDPRLGLRPGRKPDGPSTPGRPRRPAG